MVLLTVLDVLLSVVGAVGMVYQGVCIVASLFAKPVTFPEAPMDKRYAVLISARNEENVIGNLITCLHEQTYPSELIDIWVVADNCTDDTAGVVRDMGCHVVERHNLELVGKGYALTYLLDYMIDAGLSDTYDAYFEPALHDWDVPAISAAAVVVWEAQGALHRWDGSDIHWRQNNDIVCTNGLIDRELKPILTQH